VFDSTPVVTKWVPIFVRFSRSAKKKICFLQVCGDYPHEFVSAGLEAWLKESPPRALEHIASAVRNQFSVDVLAFAVVLDLSPYV
jgi:hypothetical protein